MKMRRATDMTVEEFKAHLRRQMDEVLHFDNYREGQRRATRTQQTYSTKVAMQRGRTSKWGYFG